MTDEESSQRTQHDDSDTGRTFLGMPVVDSIMFDLLVLMFLLMIFYEAVQKFLGGGL